MIILVARPTCSILSGNCRMRAGSFGVCFAASGAFYGWAFLVGGRPGASYGLLCLPARSFVAVFVTYCGLGTFIKSRLPNHSDACYNNIPQRDFWFDLPSLVSDGAAKRLNC